MATASITNGKVLVVDDALDALSDNVALLDHAGDIIAVNRAWIEFAAANDYGDPCAGVGANYLTVCSADPRDNVAGEVAQAIREVLAGEREAFETTYPCHTPDQDRWFSVTVRPMRRAGMGQVAAIVLHRDRTPEIQRLGAERRLVSALETVRRTEERLREQFAKLPVPTFLFERRGIDQFELIDANHAALAMVTHHGRVRIGAMVSEIVPAEWEMASAFEDALGEGHVVSRRNLRIRPTEQHDERTFDLTIGPQPPDRILLHAIETTEQTRLAADLRQAQKMEAVGQLAGGVAHDFNNLLTVIGAHCSFLFKALPPGTPSRADAEAIQTAADRAAELTRQLLAFSRKQLLAPAVIDANTIVDGAHRLLRRLLSEDIEMILELSSSPQWVHADPGQLEQVLLNLAVNARDAMPSGGRLTISVTATTVTVDNRPERFIAPGEYVCLRVRDTGVGMNAAVRSRIFEPFFTTKEPGRGTGLGLSTAYGIIKQSDGYLTVSSEPGAGATFDIYLPRRLDPCAVVAESSSSHERTRAHAATILLVEDDAAVRDITVRVLRHEGFEVIEATHGAEGVRIAEQLRKPLDVVISDAVMPGIGGGEVIRRITALHPRAAAILVSGYTNDEMARRGIQSADFAFLQKPFAPSELISQIDQMLQRRADGQTHLDPQADD